MWESALCTVSPAAVFRHFAFVLLPHLHRQSFPPLQNWSLASPAHPLQKRSDLTQLAFISHSLQFIPSALAVCSPEPSSSHPPRPLPPLFSSAAALWLCVWLVSPAVEEGVAHLGHCCSVLETRAKTSAVHWTLTSMYRYKEHTCSPQTGRNTIF